MARQARVAVLVAVAAVLACGATASFADDDAVPSSPYAEDAYQRELMRFREWSEGEEEGVVEAEELPTGAWGGASTGATGLLAATGAEEPPADDPLMVAKRQWEEAMQARELAEESFNNASSIARHARGQLVELAVEAGRHVEDAAGAHADRRHDHVLTSLERSDDAVARAMHLHAVMTPALHNAQAAKAALQAALKVEADAKEAYDAIREADWRIANATATHAAHKLAELHHVLADRLHQARRVALHAQQLEQAGAPTEHVMAWLHAAELSMAAARATQHLLTAQRHFTHRTKLAAMKMRADLDGVPFHPPVPGEGEGEAEESPVHDGSRDPEVMAAMEEADVAEAQASQARGSAHELSPIAPEAEAEAAAAEAQSDDPLAAETEAEAEAEAEEGEAGASAAAAAAEGEGDGAAADHAGAGSEAEAAVEGAGAGEAGENHADHLLHIVTALRNIEAKLDAVHGGGASAGAGAAAVDAAQAAAESAAAAVDATAASAMELASTSAAAAAAGAGAGVARAHAHAHAEPAHQMPARKLHPPQPAPAEVAIVPPAGAADGAGGWARPHVVPAGSLEGTPESPVLQLVASLHHSAPRFAPSCVQDGSGTPCDTATPEAMSVPVGLHAPATVPHGRLNTASVAHLRGAR